MAATTAALVAVAISALAAGGSAVQQNQEVQHAKGAAQAQQTAMDAQIKTAQDQDTANKSQQASAGSATQAAALAALRASMSASSGMGGSLLTGPGGAAPAPTATKSLLGV